MTQKKIIINNCLECPHLEPGDGNGECGIDKKSRSLRNLSRFPDWCELEDV